MVLLLLVSPVAEEREADTEDLDEKDKAELGGECGGSGTNAGSTLADIDGRWGNLVAL